MSLTPLQAIRIGTLVDATSPNPAAYIQEILPYGFESFQLTFGAGIDLPDLQELSDGIQAVLDGTDAVVSALGVYGNPLLETEQGLKTRESWGVLIEHSALFGASVVAGFTGRITNTPIDESIRAFGRIFDPIAEIAGEQGVKIAFENCAMGGDWYTGDWNIAHGPDAWELMFEKIPHDHVGLEWEPCHQLINLIDPISQLKEWADRIVHVHGKCASVYHDVIAKTGIRGSRLFAHHRTPGFGDTNWTDVFSILRTAGYGGTVDIEGWHDPVYRDELEMTGQVAALRYLQRCRGGTFIPNPQI